MTSTSLFSTVARRGGVALALAGLVATLLWGCGGVGTGGTGDYAESSITGFGSVIVGGVEFDDSAAVVLDDDGHPLTRNGNELRLGMTLEVGGTGLAAQGQAANTVRVATAVLGPVESVDVGARTLTVLGQTLELSASTVFGPPLHGGLSSLKPGDVVAAYAFSDALGHALATRIENAPGAQTYRLRGLVSALDPATQTLRIGGATLRYTHAAGVPADLANGQLVRVQLPARSAAAVIDIDAFGPAASRPRDADSALVEGLVTAFTSAAAFSVNGLPVDASQASVEAGGPPVAAGAFVSVRGRISAGTLVASTLAVQGASAIDARSFQVTGVIASIDAAAQTFVVRNVEVDYSTASFVNLTPTSLAAGLRVQVEGPLSADGSRIRATNVTLR